jgi:hypothetical protein
MGQDPNRAVDPLSGAVEYPPIEYHPAPPPGYPMPPMPPPLPPSYGPATSFPPPGPFPPPGAYPPPGPFPPPGAYPPPGPFPPAGANPPRVDAYGPPPSAYTYGPPYTDPTSTNGKAIGALVTSLVGVPLCFCAVPSIVGIVLGIVAMNDIKKTGQQGHGMALAAVIVGGVSLALTVLFWLTGVITDTSTYR